jgi:hypothetical protein
MMKRVRRAAAALIGAAAIAWAASAAPARSADYESFVAAELGQSKQTLEQRLNKPVEFLAWPYGIVDADLERAAVQAGYSAAFIVGGRRARAGGDAFALPRIVVSDADRGDKFERLLLGAGGAPPASP